MNIFDRIDRKLRQSSEVMSRAGAGLLDKGFVSENDVRNAIWRCLLCRHGDDCRDWLAAGRTDVPDFCPNRETYLRHARH